MTRSNRIQKILEAEQLMLEWTHGIDLDKYTTENLEALSEALDVEALYAEARANVVRHILESRGVG